MINSFLSTGRTKKLRVGRSGFFSPPFFIDYDVLIKLRTKSHQKKFQAALFCPPGRWTGNNFLFKGGLRLGV